MKSKEEKTCINTFCKKRTEKELKQEDEFTEKTIKKIKKNYETISKKGKEKVDEYILKKAVEYVGGKERWKELSSEDKKRTMNNFDPLILLKNLEEIKKNNKTKKNRKRAEDACNSIYCNIGCKGTILQKEPAIEFKKKLRKSSSKLFQKLTDNILKKREKLFQENNDNVLNDNFFVKLTPKQTKKIKKKGGISFCSEYAFP